MNGIAPLPTPAAGEVMDRTRLWSILSTVLFVPAALVFGVLTSPPSSVPGVA